jgi:hypothetical protein
MTTCVCLSANTLTYPEGGGHLWIYLNWALGLKALGCRVQWLEAVAPDVPAEQARALTASLRDRLGPFGLAEGVALCSEGGGPLPAGLAELGPDFGADLLLNFQYGLGPRVVGRFRRSALVDIDPGLLQTWMAEGSLHVARHDVHFTIGETVGRPGARFPDGGREWHHTPPCVALDWWPPMPAAEGAAFTTVSHWSTEETVEEAGEWYQNDKRAGFLPYLDLPRRTSVPLELALCLASDEEEDRSLLREHGWHVRDASTVTATSGDYQRYVQASRGELSCAKPSYVRLPSAWVSDRTICYLASGKPVVVQHTGESRLLPDAAGMFRFRDVDEAARHLEAVTADYERQRRLAQALAEEHFDARKVVRRVLERALA